MELVLQVVVSAMEEPGALQLHEELNSLWDTPRFKYMVTTCRVHTH